MRRTTVLVWLAWATTVSAQTSSPPREITVFAAASLTDAFQELAALMEEDSIRVRYNFAGSQQLAVQLEQGARADVFASADQRWMDYVLERQLTTGPPKVFAHNRLVAIVPRSNPGGILELQDLARRGLKLVVGAETVPVGKYFREMLHQLERLAGFPPAYGDSVLANVVSQEENVKSVVAKVQLGEADAGIVYRSDVTPRVAPSLTVLDIPEDANVVASYPVAVLRTSAHPAAAQAFVALLLSPDGRRVLSRHGLTPAATTP